MTVGLTGSAPTGSALTVGLAFLSRISLKKSPLLENNVGSEIIVVIRVSIKVVK